MPNPWFSQLWGAELRLGNGRLSRTGRRMYGPYGCPRRRYAAVQVNTLRYVRLSLAGMPAR